MQSWVPNKKGVGYAGLGKPREANALYLRKIVAQIRPLRGCQAFLDVGNAGSWGFLLGLGLGA